MGAIVAVLNKKGEDAAETAVTMLEILKLRNVEAFGIGSPITVKIEKSIEALRNQDIKSSVVIGHAFSKILASDRPQPIKLENATLVCEGRIYPTIKEISYIEDVARKLPQSHEEAINTIIKKTDAGLALVLAEPEKLIVGRDAMGVSPLYYGESTEVAALASELKALWKIGMTKARSFPPGHVALVNAHGSKFRPAKTLAYAGAKHITMQKAVKKLQTLLRHSIKERVSGLKEVAIAFSGGLDSGLTAFLAKVAGVNAHLIHISLTNQPEIEYAKKAAEKLRMPIHVFVYNEKDVERVLPSVLWLIEEPSPVMASIGIPFYWAAEKAADMQFKVMLAGQGADELFGGYARYLKDYARCGSERVQRTILNDIFSMYEANFERDSKICNFHNVELRMPFATYQIAKFAMDLPLELKIESPSDMLRKLVLRRVAKNLGLPELIVGKPKRAIQYTTGTTKALKKLAKREGLSMKEYVQRIFQTTFKKMA